ncbi:hypothetical protein Pfo_027999 [Paulownia fortunei]|nr:hypothetical protein Pfo_027999 [Paulownia fortunei]
MGGHGGLNILPQKRWNVYNYENREKVRRDEEAAAKEEQLKREQARKRDAEFRLEKLRQARGLTSRDSAHADDEPSSPSIHTESVAEPSKSESDSKHINLFEGIRIFDRLNDNNRNKKVKREEVRAVGPEDEKYRLGYGLAGKGVKLPWYMEKRVADEKNRKSGGKKTLEELREERLKRERKEKERERALLMVKSKKDGVLFQCFISFYNDLLVAVEA